MRKFLAITIAAGAVTAVAPVAYAATTGASECVTINDHITKTDSGHGTPAEWADLSMRRTTVVCPAKAGYDVTLTDSGHLWTRPGAGSPNGSGTSIANRVPGVVAGRYSLTVTGGTLTHQHGNTAVSSTEYVRSLFSADATVNGGAYAWAYKTCREHWLDSSANNDGQGAAAGNITGLRCHPHHSPTPTPTDSGTPSPSPTDTTAPGEAPKPTPVPSDLPVTG